MAVASGGRFRVWTFGWIEPDSHNIYPTAGHVRRRNARGKRLHIIKRRRRRLRAVYHGLLFLQGELSYEL